MSYEPLHHKYRPQTFKDLVGQEAIANTLINAIELEKIAPAYLFTGPRGTGKTSSARILAKSLNCLAHDKPTPIPCGKCEVCQAIAFGNALDVIEIDAASNTGVDNIREIIERSRFAPVQSRYKVYAIDECHMLSTAAFNALLKTLEEPPPQVVFILATTDPQRVLSTIISRCQRFDYRRIRLEAMVSHLKYIAEQENIAIATEALTLTAQIANGGLRDAESLLDQLSLFPEKITVDKIWDLVGAVPERDLLALLSAIRKEDIEDIVTQCRNLMDRGREPLVLLQNLAGFYLNLLIAKTSPNRQDLVAVTETCWQHLCTEAQHWQFETILQGQQQLKDGEVQIKNTTQPRLWLEVTLLGLLNKAAISPNIPQQKTITQHKPLAPENHNNTATVRKQPLTDENSVNNQANIAALTNQNPTQPKAKNTAKQHQAVPKTSQTAIAKQQKVTQTPVQEHSDHRQQETAPDTRKQRTATAIPINNQAVTAKQKPPVSAPTNASISPDRQAVIWQQVIDCIHPPMTQALLRQQCHLISLTDSAAIVGISSAKSQKMNQGRVPNIEAAFAKVCQRKIKVTLEVASKQSKFATKVATTAPDERSPISNTSNPIRQDTVNKQNYDDAKRETGEQGDEEISRIKNQYVANLELSVKAPPEIPKNIEPQTIPTSPVTIAKEPITENNLQSETNGYPAATTPSVENPDDFAKAVELVAQKFDGEVIEFKDSYQPGIASTTETIEEQLAHSQVSSEIIKEETKPSTLKQQKVVIRRDVISSDYDDDDVPF
ncbi:DNA polymerase III subunit gamma/tau [Hyella patelloides LEGE 07179]|uniref:DNA polymerase III subunit gamma/tau n=1 Tax=Hyella patelloides LEGE 07179 TaxID=945734 RepID=A0A563W3R6_9CYAN|nr:DNA polymerase III subunit gamma/tau [Hyella patelloides]VEP18332.1 DNA polymerase III subunit gamma/tau [Hyella patelloides LEGE 07179]